MIFCLLGIISTIYVDISNSGLTAQQNTRASAAANDTTQDTELSATSTASSRSGENDVLHTEQVATSSIQKDTSKYIEVTNSCSIQFSVDCLSAYSQPSSTSTARQQLRNGMVLLIDEKVESSDGAEWYRISFDEWLKYPERLELPWYVPAKAGDTFRGVDSQYQTADTPTTTKHIVIERSTQMLYAYEGE